MSCFLLALAGALLVIPAGLLQVRLEDALVPLGTAGETLPWILIRAFVITALVEEAGKLALLLAWSRNHPDAGPRGWLAAGLSVGGGFAALEMLGNLIGGPTALLASLALAVPSHLLDGVLLATRVRRPGGVGRGLALVVLLHGLWDTGVFLLQAEQPAGAQQDEFSLRLLVGVGLVLGVYLTQWVLGVRDGRAAYREGASGSAEAEGSDEVRSHR